MNKSHLLIIFIVSLVLGWQLFRVGYYPMHDDLQVMRMYQMDVCFRDGQIPCRWVPDMGYGYGQPMFNFYSAFPYYLGQFLHLFGLSYVDTVKIVFYLSLLVSMLATYLLALIFVSPSSALVSSVAYLSFPYHALDIFVRGAMAESWGLALVPLVLYALLKYLSNPVRRIGILLSLSLGALTITHNITTLITVPIFLLFMLWGITKYKPPIQLLRQTLLYCLLGVALGGFFTLPLTFEKNLIQTQFFTADYFDFHAHFASVKQLFVNQNWGYGPSKFGVDDDLSFYFGLVQTIVLFVSPILYFLKHKNPHAKLFLAFSFLSLFFLFLTHNKSVYLWERLPLISIAQFPWRFLGPAGLFSSLMLGTAFEIFFAGNFLKIRTMIGIILLLVILNFRFFAFEKYFYWIDDSQKLSGELLALQARAAILDYLPVSSSKIPIDPAPTSPIVTSGRVSTNYFDKRSNYFSSEFDVYTDTATVQFPVMHFPGWKYYINRQPTPVTPTYSTDFGLPSFSLTRGHHLIQAFFEDTPVRRFGNYLTLFSLGIIIYLSLNEKSKK